MLYVERCAKCQQIRQGGMDRPPLQKRINASTPFSRISIDTAHIHKLDAQGQGRILVIVDEFTRYAIVIAVRNETAPLVSKVFFEQVVLKFGIPEELLSDRGANFLSNIFMYLMERLNVRKISTTAFHPQGNGANERMHRTLYTILRGLSENGGKDWKARLPMALYVYNNMVHSALGMSPHEALFGYRNRQVTMEYYRPEADVGVNERLQKFHEMHVWVKEHMDRVQELRNTQINEGRSLRSYEPGDYVKYFVHRRDKLGPKWIGPVRVVKKTGPVNYLLDLDLTEDEETTLLTRKHPIVHALYLRPWYLGEPEEYESIDPAEYIVTWKEDESD